MASRGFGQIKTDKWAVVVVDKEDHPVEYGGEDFHHLVGPFDCHDDAEQHPTKLEPGQTRFFAILRMPDDPMWRSDGS